MGREAWKDGFKNTERKKEYVNMKECPRRERFSDGHVGAKVRLMVRGSETMKWKYQDDLCGCGQVETEEHVLFKCSRYGQERERWRGAIERVEVTCVHMKL